MKVERKEQEKAFEPIMITLETEEEAALIHLLFTFPSAISRGIEQRHNKYSSGKIHRAISEIAPERKLKKYGIDNEIERKYFQKE